jgi:hypothetical protein
MTAREAYSRRGSAGAMPAPPPATIVGAVGSHPTGMAAESAALPQMGPSHRPSHARSP